MAEKNVPWGFSAARVLTLREFHGLTHEAFARRIGCAASQIRSWENGKGCPSMKTLLMMCNEFGVLPASFFIPYVHHGDKH
jgi:transcriptional regulator with XRE-family HTH domain